MKRRISLKTLMVAMISILIILPMATLSLLNYRDSVADTHKKYAEEMTINAEGVKNSVEARLTEADTIMKSLSKDPDILSGDGNRQRALLEKVAKMQPLFELIYITDKTGMQTARSAGENANRADREWFQKALKGEYYFSGSYISKATNQPTVTIALPLKNEAGSIIGTIGGDLSLGNLQSLVKDIKIGNTGYAFVTDQMGIAIASPFFDEYVLKQKDISTTLSVADALKGNKNVANWVNSKGVTQYGAYMPISTPDTKSNWTVTMQIPQEELDQLSRQILLKDAVVTLVLTIVASILTYFASNIFINPVKKVMEITSRVSQGDLTVSASNKTLPREFLQLYDAVNDMIGKLRELLQTTSRNAHLVSNASTQLTEASTSMSVGADQVAATMEQLSAGNQDQTAQVDIAAIGMENLRSEVKTITERANQVHQLTQALDEESRRSMEGMNHATNQMAVMKEDSRKSADQIISLENKSGQIEQTVTLITEIAQQTNLLALNAAIEAARAGDAGRGFAVVADEVRKLAEQSGKAAEKITSIITDIRHETGLAVKLMTQSADGAEKGVQAVFETLNSLEQITKAIDEVVNHTSDVAESTGRMYESMEEVSSVVSNLASISEQSAAATQEVTASVTEQSSTTQQLANSARDLAMLSNDLEETVKKFKLE